MIHYDIALYPAIAFLTSLVLTLVVMPLLLAFCKQRGLYDMPNERKVHKNNIPRLGGAVFLPAALMGAVVAVMPLLAKGGAGMVFKLSTIVVFAGMFLIYMTGLLDDVLGLSAKLKFAVQLAASLVMPLCGLYINNLYGFCGIYEVPLWVGYPLTIFISLLVVNAINLIDGIDGLASGLSVIALTVLFVKFAQLNVLSYTIFIAALVGSVLAFMRFNLFGKVERATKTFMGDTGSLILGYAIAFFAFKYMMDNESVLPCRDDGMVVSFTVVLVPVFDLIRVALIRLSKHVSIFHPDKTHLHHRLLATGLSMRRTLGVILLLQVAYCLLNAVMHYVLEVNVTWIFLADILLSETFYFVVALKTRQVPHSANS